MDALEALHTRSSCPRLGGPAPEATKLALIYQAAFRAADHGRLQPWRFLQIGGDSRALLGDLFVKAALSNEPDLSEGRQEMLRNKPQRAPVIIVIVASPQAHPKVPDFEQEYSAAAATQNMLVACHALGVGAMWRTGSMARHPVVAEGLGLKAGEKIIGFLYLGEPDGPARPIPVANPEKLVQVWPS